MTSEKADVVVVGGGLVGTSAAYHLAKEKVKVTVLEQNAVGSGTSFHGSGDIGLPSHYINPPELGRLVWTGAQLQREVTPAIAEESGIDVLFREHPATLSVAVTEEAWAEMQERDRARDRFMAEMGAKPWGEGRFISAEEAYKVEPRLGREIEIYGAQHRTGGPFCFVDPYRLTIAYAQLADKYGAQVLNRTVVGLVKEGSRITGVQTSTGERILCEHVVLAMGNWTPLAEEWLGVPLPVRAIKGDEIRLSYDGPTVAVSAHGVNIRPLTFYGIVLRGDGVYNVGHTTTESYVWESRDRRKPYVFDNALSLQAAQVLLDFTVKLPPCMSEARLVGHVAGPRPIPPDGMPMIGPIPGWEGVYVCVGNPGIMCSYHWGQVMRDLVLGRPLSFSLEPFLPDRFAEGKPVRGRYGIMSFDVS